MAKVFKLSWLFLWLVLRPFGKLESAFGWVDVMVGLIQAVYYITFGSLYTATIQQETILGWLKGNSLWFLVGLPILLLFIAGVKLQFKLASYEEKLPKLEAKLLSFPQSGTRVTKDKDLHSPEKGYAKIAVINKGGLCKDCVARVVGLSVIDQGKLKQLVFDASFLKWDTGDRKADIQNDGVPRHLYLAYLDQNKPLEWRLAVDHCQHDCGAGWWKVDVVISSESQGIKPLNLEIAVGLGDRTGIPSPLNLQYWDRVYSAIQKRRQVSHKGDSQT